MNLNVEGWKWDTSIGNMMKNMLKIQGSIAPRALINIGNFINVMGFPGLIHIQGLSSCNINIAWNKYSVDCCICIPSTLYFNCWTHFCAWFLPDPVILPVPIPASSLTENLTLFFIFGFLYVCDYSLFRNLWCTYYFHFYERLLTMSMIWCKKIPPLF